MPDAMDLIQERVLREQDWLASDAARRASDAVSAVVDAAACLDCGDEIDPRRRAAMPTARRCVDCESNQEDRRG